ncbi:MAG: alpha/beta fold hydrolase [Bernardetiaceae bacterium]
MAFYWMDFRTAPEAITGKLKGFAHRSLHYTHAGRRVHYVQTGEDAAPPVVFVHGAPGDWSAFAEIMTDSTLQKNSCLVSVDRLGYGQSGFGQSEVSILKQAQSLLPVLDRLSGPALLVGHSFGGPIVAQMAALAPEKVAGLFLIAPAIDPAHEVVLWASYPADWPAFRWLMPPVWRVTNDEKLAHVAQLHQLEPIWAQLQTPTLFLHGQRDYLVPIENAYFGAKKMTQAPVQTHFPKDLDHLIPFTHPQVVVHILHEYLQTGTLVWKNQH